MNLTVVAKLVDLAATPAGVQRKMQRTGDVEARHGAEGYALGQHDGHTGPWTLSVTSLFSPVEKLRESSSHCSLARTKLNPTLSDANDFEIGPPLGHQCNNIL